MISGRDAADPIKRLLITPPLSPFPPAPPTTNNYVDVRYHTEYEILSSLLPWIELQRTRKFSSATVPIPGKPALHVEHQ